LYKFRLPLGIAGVITILDATALIVVELLAIIESPARTASISRTVVPAFVSPVVDENVVASGDRKGRRLAVVVVKLGESTTFTTSSGIEKTYEKRLYVEIVNGLVSTGVTVIEIGVTTIFDVTFE